MLFLSKLASKRNEWRWMVFAIIIYATLFGMRYGVGEDHLSYTTDYLHLSNLSIVQHDDTEIGFKFIRNTLAQNNVHITIYFGLIAFLQLWLVFKSVKQSRTIYPYLVTSFFLGCIWLTYANGLRQQLAFCIFAYSLLFVNNKFLPLHCIFILLAASMHQSAVLLFGIAPLMMIKKDWFTNIKIQYLLLVSAIIIGQLPQIESFLVNSESKLALLSGFLEETGYDHYYEYKDGDVIFRERDTVGIGYYIELIINIILICFCNTVKTINKENKIVTYMYNLTFVGILLHYAFITSPAISRLNYYFYGFTYIFGAFTLQFLYKQHKRTFVFLLALYMLTFFGTMYRMFENTSAFYFIWQNDLYGTHSY